MNKSILVDKYQTYIPNDLMPKMIERIGIEGMALYLVITTHLYKSPGGVEEMKIFKSSADPIEEQKKWLNELIQKGYAIKENGLIKTTNKQFK